jgi:hypothetical protein
MIKKVFLISFLLLLTPYFVFAENGLLPCGPGTSEGPCKLCHFFVLISNVLELVMLRIVPFLASLMFIIGGIWFYFSGASPENKRRAQAIITSSVIGIVIILSAWVIVNTILDRSGIIEMREGWQWYNIECSAENG